MQDRRSGGGTCPICGEPADAEYRPFCSRRCADIDLARWLKGTYAIPGGRADEEDETQAPDDGQNGTADSSSKGRHEDE